MRYSLEYDFPVCFATDPLWQSEVSLQLAVNILKGVSVRKNNVMPSLVIYQEDIDKFLRPEFSDLAWSSTSLPTEFVVENIGLGRYLLLYLSIMKRDGN